MTQLILSPTSTSIYATLSGLETASFSRVLQFFKNEATGTPLFEDFIQPGQVRAQYSHVIAGLKTNEEYVIIARLTKYDPEELIEDYIEKATCGGSSKDPSFSVSDITSNSAIVNIYRGTPSYSYYRLYVFDTVDEEAIFTDWLKPNSYPKQLTGLEDGRTYKINVGYGNIYGGGVTWIGTQTFTTTAEFDTGHSDEGEFTMPDRELDRNILRNNTSSLKTSPFNDRYTRVTITTKDEESNSDIAYSVGNDDGLELEVSCPWIGANEHDAIKIATYVLSTISTYKYEPYTANETLLDPAAELGDIISFDTVTSELINLDINYESLFNADISAPTSNETEHEFPQGATSKDSTKRYVDGIRAALEVELDKITAMVEANDGRFQKLQVTLDGVIIQNEEGQTIINGAHIQTGTIELTEHMYNNAAFTTKIGAMDNATANAQTSADAAQAAANAAQSTADSKPSSSRVAQIAATQIVNDLRNNYDITSENNHSVLTSAYIYSPNLVGGEAYDVSVTINEYGILFGTYNDETETVIANYARMGYEEIAGGYKLPIMTLGQGTGSSSNPAASFRKYFNGIWIGELFSDSDRFFDPANSGSNTGIFLNFANDSLVLDRAMYGPTLPDKNSAMEGQIFFKLV